MSNGKCKGSFAQVRRITNAEEFGVGKRLLILRHPECDCNSGCRRVTLWHPRPAIAADDGFVIKPLARVRWGDGCGGPEVEVDWKHGVILDLSGCYDEVSLEFVEVSGTLPVDFATRSFDFGVLSACCGAGGARGCATRTTARFEVEADGSIAVPIPPFAYAVQFVPVDPAAFFVSTTSLTQSGSGSNSDASLAVQTGDILPDPWSLVNGAETIIVSNGGAEEINFEVMFLIGV
jgi:hypothetical protein